MTTFNVYAFNEGFELANILTGIQHFLISGDFRAIMIMALMVAMVAAIISFLKKTSMPYWFLVGIFMPIVMYTACIGAKAKVNITDMYSNEVFTISNLPLGLALPLSISSHIEWGLTKIIDEKVTPVSAPSFKEVDFMGHARLMEHLNNPNLYVSPHVVQSLTSYGRDCMLPALANGLITFTELRTSGTLSTKMNLNLQALFTKKFDVNGNSAIDTCGNVFPYILNELSAIVSTGTNTAFRKQTTSIFGRKAEQPAQAVAAMTTAVKSMFSGFQDAPEQLFQQFFLINGIKNTISTVDPTLGLAVAEAEQKQSSSSIVAGILNIKQLSKYRTFMKLFLITIMPIIMAFWVFNNGKTFWSWCGLFIWVSLFMPIEAAVHAVYVATSLSELRQYTDPFNGLSLVSQPSVMKWATETNAMASTFMLGIVAFSGLIMKICWPSIGQAVMAMGASDQTRQRFQAQSAANALQNAQAKAVSLETDSRINNQLLGFQGAMGQEKYGALNQEIGKSMMQQYSAFNDNTRIGGGLNLSGASAATPENTMAALSAQRGGSTKFTLSGSEQASRSLSASVTQARGQMHSVVRGLQQVNGFVMTDSQSETMAATTLESTGLSKTQQGQSIIKEARSQAFEDAQRLGFSTEQSASITSKFAAKFGGSLFGTGIDFSNTSTDSHGNKTTSELTQSQKDVISTAKESAFTEAVNEQRQWSESLQYQQQSASGQALKSEINNMMSDLTTTSNSLQRQQTAQTQMQEMRGVGGQKSVDITQLMSQKSSEDIQKDHRTPGGEVDALINKGGSHDRLVWQNAALNDIEKQYDNDDRGGLAHSFRQLGQERLANAIEAGADISREIGGASSGISSAPGLPGQKSSAYGGSPAQLLHGGKNKTGNSGGGDATPTPTTPLPNSPGAPDTPGTPASTPPATPPPTNGAAQVTPEQIAQVKANMGAAVETAGFKPNEAQQVFQATQTAKTNVANASNQVNQVLGSAMRGEISAKDAAQQVGQIMNGVTGDLQHLEKHSPTFAGLMQQEGISIPQGPGAKLFTNADQQLLEGKINELQGKNREAAANPSSLRETHTLANKVANELGDIEKLVTSNGLKAFREIKELLDISK